MRGNVIVGQSGGPTAVINASVAGVYKAAKQAGVPKVYGMVYGIQGFPPAAENSTLASHNCCCRNACFSCFLPQLHRTSAAFGKALVHLFADESLSPFPLCKSSSAGRIHCIPADFDYPQASSPGNKSG